MDCSGNIFIKPDGIIANRKQARKAFENTFVIVQDPFLTETTEVADIVLPPAMWGEIEGTMENADRTINLLRKAIEPSNGVKSDFEILIDFSKRMGFTDKDGKPLIQYSTPEECFEEWKKVSIGRPADMSGITYEKLEKHNGLRWPVTENTPFGHRVCIQLSNSTLRQITRSHMERTYLQGDPELEMNMKQWTQMERRYCMVRIMLPPQATARPEFPFWLTTGRLVRNSTLERKPDAPLTCK